MSLATKIIKEADSRGRIDTLAAIKETSVYVFHGAKDQLVNITGGKLNAQLIKAYGANVYEQYTVPAIHSWVTDDYGVACNAIVKPWIVNCDFNLAFDMLTYLHGPLLDPVPADEN